MFRFVVNYLGFLKHISIFAWIFDATFVLWNAVFNPNLTQALDVIENRVAAWNDVTLRVHKFGGIQFNYKKKEIGHIHSNGILDILFSIKTKKYLIQQGHALEHHLFKKSGWVTFYIHSEGDIEKAIWLLKLSYSKKTTNSVG